MKFCDRIAEGRRLADEGRIASAIKMLEVARDDLRGENWLGNDGRWLAARLDETIANYYTLLLLLDKQRAALSRAYSRAVIVDAICAADEKGGAR